MCGVNSKASWQVNREREQKGAAAWKCELWLRETEATPPCGGWNAAGEHCVLGRLQLQIARCEG